MKKRLQYLLAQYYHNRSTQQEWEELLDFIQQGELDDELGGLIRELYVEFLKSDTSSTFVNKKGRISKPLEFSSADSTGLKTRRLKFIKKAAAVAAIGLIAFSVDWSGQKFASQPPVERVQVIKQSVHEDHKVILLADGSKVWLNEGSRLEYPNTFTEGAPREVTLIGEAFFEVEKAQDWPFIVHTGGVETKVLGTEFNVKAYPEMEDVLVSVRSGKVMVSHNRKTLATLVRNQELRIPVLDKPGIPLEASQIVEKDLHKKIAGSWKDGHLEYEDETFASIIGDLERFYQISIELERPELGRQIITTSVSKSSDPSEIIKILSRLLNTEYRKTDKQYIIL